MPRYDYKCNACGHEFEVVMSSKLLDKFKISCEKCLCDTKRLISKTQGKPLVLDTYNESADAHFTGPAQRARVLKEKGLVEAPNIMKEWGSHRASPKPYSYKGR